MKIVISPAKTMKEFAFAYGDRVQMPRYEKQTMAIYQEMCKKDIQELCTFCKISEKLGMQSMRYYQDWRFDELGTPAIFTYHGIQYLALNAQSLSDDELAYANQHVRILSGLYGSLRPLDCVYPYRLEMQAPLAVGYENNLYEYWTSTLYDDLSDDILLDLASQEYSAVIDPRIKESKQYFKILFFVEKDGIRKAISTAIKAARGAMLRAIILAKMEDVQAIKALEVNGFRYDPVTSSEQVWTFVLEK